MSDHDNDQAIAEAVHGKCVEIAARMIKNKKIRMTAIADYTTLPLEEVREIAIKSLPPVAEGLVLEAPFVLDETRTKIVDTISRLMEGTVYIPNTVSDLEKIYSWRTVDFVKIAVKEDHPYFAIEDEILYNRTKTTLLMCMNEKKTGTVRIPDTVTCIADRAFAYCVELESVILSPNINHIGTEAFNRCTRLENVIFPQINNYIGTYTYIGAYAFNFCTHLKKVDFPQGLTYIGKDAFSCCYELTAAILPDTVTEMGESVFAMCGALTEVHLPKELTVIPETTFFKCRSLQHIHIPESVQQIGGNAFCDSALKEIHIPSGVRKIGFAAFCDCDKLASVVLHEGIEEIERFAFAKCRKIKCVHIPKSLQNYGNEWRESRFPPKCVLDVND